MEVLAHLQNHSFFFLFLILLLTFIDSFPPFIFVLPIPIILASFFYINALQQDLLNLILLILFPLFSTSGDIIYMKFYSNNKISQYIKRKLGFKEKKFKKEKLKYFLMTRINVFFKLSYFSLFRKMNRKICFLIFLVSFIQVLVVFIIVYLIKIMGVFLNIKYLDYLLLLISLIILFHAFNLKEKEIIGNQL